MLQLLDGSLHPIGDIFLAEFSHSQSQASSTLREVLGILWCTRATNSCTKHRLVFICDNMQSCRAILRGSRNKVIQSVAEAIFLWCLRNNKVCWPIWVPWTHRLIVEADRHSRLSIPHDERSPQAVVDAADRLALATWGVGLSFDQAASHVSAITVRGRTLPFNAFCFQPGASGIDIVRCLRSWAHNVNYVFPPAPMTGRLLSFLPSTRAKSVIALKLPLPNEWWSYSIQPHSPGLVCSSCVCGFMSFLFDFS